MRFAVWILLGSGLLLAAAPQRLLADGEVSFCREIAPILLENCFACHGPKKAEGGYRLDSFELLGKPGDSQADAFKAGSLDDSEAYRRITSDDADERMPLEGEPLPADEIAIIKTWIEQGAKFDGPDPKLPLPALIPPPVYPAPPAAYRKTIPITALAFSPAGDELFVGGYHEITVWIVADGALKRHITNVPERTFALVISPDGKLLAAAGGAPGRRGEVRLFHLETGELAGVLSSTADVVFDAAFSPQGDRLATAGADSTIRVYKVEGGEELLHLENHADWVTAITFSPDGKKLASASRDKTAKVFDAQSGEPLIAYNEHNDAVFGVAFAPDGAEVFSSGGDRRIRVWQVADGKKTAELTGFGGQVNKLVLGGDLLFAPANDNQVRQFSIKDRKQIRAYAGHKDWVLSAAYHAGTERLASGSFDGEVKIWNTADGQNVLSFIAVPGQTAETK